VKTPDDYVRIGLARQDEDRGAALEGGLSDDLVAALVKEGKAEHYRRGRALPRELGGPAELRAEEDAIFLRQERRECTRLEGIVLDEQDFLHRRK
jgi:hypothetical protein